MELAHRMFDLAREGAAEQLAAYLDAGVPVGLTDPKGDTLLILAEEYRTADKIFFGTDFPFAGVAESADGLININKQVEGTSLPRVSEETIQSILWSNPFKTWWKGDNPLG